MSMNARVLHYGTHMARRVAAMISLGLAVCLLAGACAAQQPTATLKIQLDRPLHAVSPTLYGLMTEEINYSYDGGLYAEMVRNRTFQDHGHWGVSNWNIVHRRNSAAAMSLDQKEGPSTALPHSLRIEVTQANTADQAGVENEGYWGIAVHPTTTYHGSLYARACTADIGPMSISIVNDETGKALATGTVPSLSTEWKRYEFTLSTGNVEAPRDNHLQFTFGHAGTVWIDLVSLFPLRTRTARMVTGRT